MKKLLTLIIVAFGSWGLMEYAQRSNLQGWLYLILSLVGLVLGILVTLSVIRYIAPKAQKSTNWGNVFAWITGYKLRYIIREEKLVEVQHIEENKVDRENIIVALRALEIPKKEAEESADYAVEEKPNASLEEKIKIALRYINSNKLLNN